ncbi:MAG: tRNA (N6-isopentenyl adenosine(37)-C2)-methylthiotransferase MiaB [Endomicrobium sp.]|jgi:tRNA-2-methylthio-N6-dimethylallyladenosine synthase|nr:tRNA (N6-isopentenyl adenosine(37)-C2)-methylthiotransferase MiaB [Endomicrobium sp.]
MIKTIGCQINVCNSEIISDMLVNNGFFEVKNPEEANIFILNTCSIRSSAEQKAFSYLGRLEILKMKNKKLKIFVIGCMAERLGNIIKQRFKTVNLVIGNKDVKYVIFKIVSSFQHIDTKNTLVSNNKIVNYIKIMTGCNNYCTYCIVPFVCGNEHSFNFNTILNRCSMLVRRGTKKIILLGQNVNSYKYGNVDFTMLLKQIARINGVERISFMTNHPKDFNIDLINIISNEPKICTNIHIPMQSASDRILKKMNRKYTYSNYIKLIDNLRSAIPNINITTDIIVGFPTETSMDFKKTLNAVQTIKFSKVYAFKYSPRPNTLSYNMIDDVTPLEKKERLKVILKESNKISVEILSKMIGSVQEVLTEDIIGDTIKATTRCGYKVFIKTLDNKYNYLGKQLNVKIKTVKINSLIAEII